MMAAAIIRTYWPDLSGNTPALGMYNSKPVIDRIH